MSKLDKDTILTLTQSILAIVVIGIGFAAILFGNLTSTEGIYSVIGIVIGYYFGKAVGNGNGTVVAQTEDEEE
jgi:hypothetical protein